MAMLADKSCTPVETHYHPGKAHAGVYPPEVNLAPADSAAMDVL
jgi:hypothetical protein